MIYSGQMDEFTICITYCCSSYCRVETVQSATSRTCFLGWICTAQMILGNTWNYSVPNYKGLCHIKIQQKVLIFRDSGGS